jgi:hypothetical protein
MTKFKEILDKIDKNRQIANSDNKEQLDPRTYTTKLGHIKRAKENLKQLYLDYRNEIQNSVIFILATGSKSDTFIDVATKEYGCYVSDASEIYNKIADNINKRYYDNQESSPALFDLMMSSFNDICDDLDIVSYPIVYFENKYRRRLKNREDLVNLIKESFNDKVGSELVGLYAINQVTENAINDKYSGKNIPIILKGGV